MDEDAGRPDDSGLSLAEVIVSMLVLAVVAMAFLPVVARTTTAAATETAVATATRLVSRQLELARVSGATCTALRATTADVDARDGENRRYAVTTELVPVAPSTACPGLVRYTVRVARTGTPGPALATGSTYVLLENP
ncbi:hypothetical protein [Cellulomonas aerilata]|uniref:Prepilin-type N-terminal cleavage/methylation domain-containing protein n=1 Tax=Cellulomonas aerilata TaxID=515326 RepID=A0A512DA97_9CELL|nr:hypothetical protein [Cellulomonas aerilata]GEO33401.1 hypothetical protein CAE01nite_11260 [Cellulomonas aerilata]